MNKIKLKLTHADLLLLRGFVEYSFLKHKEFGYTNSKADKLILYNLSELVKKLQTMSSGFHYSNEVHKLNIPFSWGMALVMHCEKPKVYVPEMDTLVINNLIGIIDQKTI